MSKAIVILSFTLLIIIKGRVVEMKGPAEKILRDKLFDPANYDKSVRPLNDHSKPVNVSFGLRLSKLVELNTKQQLLVIDAWVVQRWMNPFLAWNQSEHQGIHTLHVPADALWVPDTVLYDNGDDEVSQAGFTEKFKTYVMLESNGMCSWMAPTTFKSSCNVDISNFPFDSQTCSMTFGSWTYDSRLLVLNQLHNKHKQAEKFTSNGDWTVRSVTIANRLVPYSCCQYPFSDVTYTFVMDRKPTYHVLYLIVPCIIISVLSLTTFYLPPDCGERVGLSITVLLAMSVYLLIVSDILPETSDFVPILGIYYMVIMGQIALIVIATAVSLRCHFSRSKPPKFVLRFSRQQRAVQPKPSNVLSMVDIEVDSSDTSVTKQLPQSEPTKNGEVVHSEEKPDVIDKESWSEHWKDFARHLDIIFLIFFSLLFFISTLAILFKRK